MQGNRLSHNDMSLGFNRHSSNKDSGSESVEIPEFLRKKPQPHRPRA